VEALVKEAKGLYDGKVFLGRILLQADAKLPWGQKGIHIGGVRRSIMLVYESARM